MYVGSYTYMHQLYENRPFAVKFLKINKIIVLHKNVELVFTFTY